MRRPPCEVVNWNAPAHIRRSEADVDLLVRSWIEMSESIRGVDALIVDLLVRSWIEMLLSLRLHPVRMSTSLWGRELKCGTDSLWEFSILSTSLWGRELKFLPGRLVSLEYLSTSLWGRELKCIQIIEKTLCNSRPPCEVVNWNDDNTFDLVVFDRRPPCEVVNWNAIGEEEDE